MPKKQKDAASAASSDQPIGTYDTVTGIDTQPKSPYGHRRQVVKTRARREMNTQAKELFRYADAAQKFFTKFKKDTDEIQWFPRPTGPQCCKNFADCSASEPRNLKIKDVRNGCRKHKDIPKNEKKGETVYRLCGLIHTGTLDRLDQDQSAGPGATDQSRYSKATSCACKSTRDSNKRSNCRF